MLNGGRVQSAELFTMNFKILGYVMQEGCVMK